MTGPDNKTEECIKMFCKTVAELNAISLKQMEGLLNIAATAAGELKSGGNAVDGGEFVNELKAVAESLSRNAKTRENELYTNVKASLSTESEDSFCQTVEQKLIVALENALSFQQQLNVTGEAILAKAASLILSSDDDADS